MTPPDGERRRSGTQHPQVRAPRPGGTGIAPTHDASDLHEVVQVVSHPGGEELLQGHLAELGMDSGQGELRRSERPASQRLEILTAPPRKQVEPTAERRPVAQVPKPIERYEAAVRTPVQDDAGARNPIGLLAVDEMADDIDRAPGVRPPGEAGPRR